MSFFHAVLAGCSLVSYIVVGYLVYQSDCVNRKWMTNRQRLAGAVIVAISPVSFTILLLAIGWIAVTEPIEPVVGAGERDWY